MKPNMTSDSGQVPSEKRPMTPTDMVRAFREGVLRGECQHPFLEGATLEQKEQHAKRLTERAAYVKDGI